MLERLERSFGHREQAVFTHATIEHVMPQTPTNEWLIELGEESIEKREGLVHTLGNLTLSAYNSELSNQPYSAKKIALCQSNFLLNQSFDVYDHWNEKSIRERGKMLANRAIQVWPDVGRKPGVFAREKEPERKPIGVRLRESQQICRNWRDGFFKLIQAIEIAEPGTLERLAEDESLYGFISKNPIRFARAKIQIGEVFINTHASASQLREWLKRFGDKAGYREDEYGFVFDQQATPPESA